MSDNEATAPTRESDSSYVVVARRYRPLGFDELVGQEHVGKALINAIETNRVGHAYLFTGARGVGKTSTARIFAKALNNPGGPDAHPDNESDVAKAIDSGEDIDVIEIDGASNRGIDEIRSLRANVGVRPSRSRYKIYIIDEVHMLTGAAFNALLKTLEEPPEHVKFIFCTTDPEKLPITVLSRCQRFDFAPVEVSKIVGRLREIVTAESAEADDDALELIARRAAGSMRDSQSLLEQVLSFSGGKLTADQVHAMLGTADDERLHALAHSMADRDAAGALKQLDEAIDAGVDAGRIAEQLLGYFRDLMAVTVGCDLSLQRHTAASMHDELAELGYRWGLQTVLAVVGLLDQVLVRIRQSVYGRVLLESALIQICHLPDLQEIANLAEAASTGAPLSSEKKNITVRRSSSTPNPAAAKPSVETPSNVASPQVTSASRSSGSVTAELARNTADSESTTAAIEKSETIHSRAVDQTGPPTRDSCPGERRETASLSKSDSSSGSSVATATAPPQTGSKTLSAQTLPEIWSGALSRVEPMTATIAGTAEKVELASAREIRLTFPANAAMSMRRLDMPEHKQPICQAVSEAVGHSVSLTFVAAAAKAASPAPKTSTRLSGKEKLERMRQIEAHPMVQACKDAFGAEVVKIEHPQ